VIKKGAKARDIEAQLAEYERELRAKAAGSGAAPVGAERESELQLV
jgi:hypothetical protein